MNVTIRAANPADAGSIARVHIDSWRTTYAGVVPAEYLASLSYQRRESGWSKVFTANEPARSIFVAETEGSDVVGFANGGPEREGDSTYRGELYAIYILQEHQNRGLGRHLVSAVTQRLLADGFSSMLVWVLEDNHRARRFYESLGGEQVGRKSVEIGGADLVEVSYGWKDIARLVVEPARAT
ncbi:MAG: GNAT family N-acetyltransferase [Chloroflexota bacterium]|nr:GNAT family N-acetyltransferase [Chloroflexota bacterium]MDE2941391.1 GNAT family N-acetyltransferase [Chloroflexota bacterium]MDE3267490.1 GNAT family N-acetyltransferase [Chloroflexota bacterium]